jgi:hypothetical protein
MHYSIFTADQPTTEKTMTATYADDTAMLASSKSHYLRQENFKIILISSKNG